MIKNLTWLVANTYSNDTNYAEVSSSAKIWLTVKSDLKNDNNKGGRSNKLKGTFLASFLRIFNGMLSL